MSDSNNSNENERLWELFIFYIMYLFSCWKSKDEETELEAVSSADIVKAHGFHVAGVVVTANSAKVNGSSPNEPFAQLSTENGLI